MDVVLWGHRSGDHGSEDWVRGLCKLLNRKPNIQSPEPGVDFRYGLGALGGLFQSPSPGACRIDAAPTNLRRWRRDGGRQVLWSPDTLSPAMVKQLGRYDGVVVTERRTQRRLLRMGLEPYLGPEPAFLVEPVYRPDPIPPNTLALSLSYPGEAPRELFESYQGLMGWLLKETDYTIALVPYCVTADCNDVLLCRTMAQPYRHSGRVLVREDGPSPILRGDLSQCRCCVGFQGAVASWGCGVPALCLQSNSRTLGLSRDLFGSSEGVWDYRLSRNPASLIERVRHFLDWEECHRNQLEQKRFSMQRPREIKFV